MLGKRVRDQITGFVGIATAKVEYINGCMQFCVTPSVDKDGKMVDGVYLDYQRLELVDVPELKLASKATGGLMSDAPSANYRG